MIITMAEFEDIFVDSNYFIALFNPQDSLYPQALTIAEQLKGMAGQCVLSNYIFLEIVTVLSQRRGRELARVAGQNLQTNPGIRIVHIDEALQRQTWELFQKTEHKNVSFVDCSAIVSMQAEHISRLLTFDDTDFSKLKRFHHFSFYT